MNDRPQRRLSAIVSADVVGYSRLMGVDETGTLNALRAHRAELIDSRIDAYGGRIVKTMGDGLLLEYTSVVDAVQSVVEIQQGMVARNENVDEARRIEFRIGVNLGDIIIEGEDILGDGVNIAARLQEISTVGGVAVSQRVHDVFRDRLDHHFTDGGELSLKNIARPIHVWRWSPGGEADQPLAAPGGEDKATPAPKLPEKPSIAVLPFDNMSGDPEQEFFVDGVVEDILTTLAKIPDLFVIARNSSFKYKNQSPDLRDVGRELGVRYIVEGSVRKAGNRVRVTAQLIECATGSHIWADRYDGELDDVFDLQDRLTYEIVTQLEVNLTEGEQVRFWRKRSGSPLVYDTYLRSRKNYTHFSKPTHADARLGCEKALEINPDFLPAMVLLGYTLVDQGRFGWTNDREGAFRNALDIADRAVKIDPEYGSAHTIISYARTYQRQHDEAISAAQKALKYCHNDATAFHMCAMTFILAGEFERGRDYELEFGRLSPIDLDVSLVELARARYHLGAYEQASQNARRVLTSMPNWLTAQTVLLSALWRLNQRTEAERIASDVRRQHPRFSVSRWSAGFPYRNQADLDALMDPLREAGLPE